MELETIEAAAAFEKENRLGGESMASAVLSTVEFCSTSAVETDAPLRTAAPQIVQLSRPNMANHAVVNCCHILF